MTTNKQVVELLAELGFASNQEPSQLVAPHVEGEAQTSSSATTLELKRADLGFRLFDYQRELVAQIDDVRNSGERFLLSLPTGAGKTRTALASVLSLLKQDPQARCLWLAPSIELLTQASDTFVKLWSSTEGAPDCSIALKTSAPEDSFLWLQTPQYVHQSYKSKQKFDLVIFDEAHQIWAPTFRGAVDKVLNKDSTLLGLTATPGRVQDSETEDLIEYFQGNLLTSATLGRNPVGTLQKRGVLSRFRFKSLSAGNKSISQKDRLNVILQLARKLVKRNRRVLVFTSSVAEAIALSIVLDHEGLPVSYVDGTLSDSQRESRLEAFRSGRLQLLFNQRLLATGYDCPAVSDVVLGAEIGSPILFEQIVGRAARGPLTGGATYSNVWEFGDHLALHGLPQSYYRYHEFSWND